MDEAGVEPPASTDPNLTDGTLQTVSKEQATFPTMPSFPFSTLVVPAQVGD
jgi:hypothetical protein